MNNIPSLATILLLDSLPLEDPSLGWKANSALWIRSFGGIFLLTLGAALQLQPMVPTAQLSLPRGLFLGLTTSCSYTAGLVLVAWQWIFPKLNMLLGGMVP
ncbi:hypothetical protein Gpo141_00010822 [Globisporangium polare]